MMDLIELADTGRRTSRIGFGGSSLMGSMGRAQSLRTLEWAYDAGIRHFDVAPAYGYGEAEACLGDFLKRHAGDVTVTTKFGIPAAKSPGWLGVARRFLVPMVKAFPGLKAGAQRAVNTATSSKREPRDLSPAKAANSLETSLRALQVERIDLFLLHDATAAEVRTPGLLEFLERARAEGKIGAFGIGTDRDHVAALSDESPACARVIQCEWSVFDSLPVDGAFRIHHRSLGANFRRLKTWLAASPEERTRWSEVTGADLANDAVLSELMVRAAVQLNAGGMILFSSKSREHIQQNATLAIPSPRDEGALRLFDLVQASGATTGTGAAR